MHSRNYTSELPCEYIIGIDLGTTKSVVGSWKAGEPHIIPDRFGYQSIPSLVLVTPEDEIFVGREAKNHPDRYKSKNITISSVKRLMGRRGETGWGWWKTYPQEVSAFILAELKNQAENYIGHEIKKAVIAIPSHFDESQRRATLESAKIAGLEVVRLLNEATAAALAYGFNKDGEFRILVLNFGGGTLDISVINVGRGVFEVLSIEGDSKLGGDDLDQVIVEYILDKIRQKYGSEVEFDPAQRLLIKELAEKAKIDLSSALSTSIYLLGLIKVGNNYHDLEVTIDRRTFEMMSRNLFDRIFPLIQKALESAHLKPSQLDAMLLLGGSSRIPFVRESISKKIGVKPITGVDLETCVAQGAIIQASILEGNLSDMLLLDVLPSSYGIGLSEDKFQKLIEKNTTVPTRERKVFTTSKDDQSTIQIGIYQGESEKASENAFLSTLELRNIIPSKAGVPQIEVIFDVNTDMVISVSAKDLGTGNNHRIELKSPYGLNDAQIKLMQIRLKSWQANKRILELKASIESLYSKIEILLVDGAKSLTWEEITVLKKQKQNLNSLFNNKASHEKLVESFFHAQSLYENAKQKSVQYDLLLKNIYTLIEKIEKYPPILKSRFERETHLLIQGRDLLKEYLELGYSYDDLQKMFSSILFTYENTIADSIILDLCSLATSYDTTNWFDPEKSMLNPDRTAKTLLKFREISEILSILNLLCMEDTEYRKAIQRRVFGKLDASSIRYSLFILIVSSFIDKYVLFEVKKNIFHETTPPLAFALFNALDSNETIDYRVKVAMFIPKYLPDALYLGVIVHRISQEKNASVKKYFIEYLDKQPSGIFSEFFLKTDPDTKAEISKNKETLNKLVKEENEEICLYTIKSLLNFSSDEIIPIVLQLINSKNLKIRQKTLEQLKKFQAHDPRIIDVFVQALLDPVSDIRLLGLDLIEEINETSFLPYLFNLLQSDQEEKIRIKAVSIINKFEDGRVIPYLLKSLMDNNEMIQAAALYGLEKNVKQMDKTTLRLFNLIKKTTNDDYSLGIRDKIFLRNLFSKQPYMNEVIQTFKQRVGQLRVNKYE